MNGNPPFLENFSEEHQRSPIPEFLCEDSRLKSLISMMLRKGPETRPILSRVEKLLKEIIAKPSLKSEPLSFLAEAGAKIAIREQRQQAEELLIRKEQERRVQLAKHACQILAENVERLWRKIEDNAPTAKRFPDARLFRVELGDAVLDLYTSSAVLPKFDGNRSGWDFIALTNYAVVQRTSYLVWSSSLIFAKAANEQDYRWYEIGYFDASKPIPTIESAPHIKAADDALPRVARYAVNPGLLWGMSSE